MHQERNKSIKILKLALQNLKNYYNEEEQKIIVCKQRKKLISEQIKEGLEKLLDGLDITLESVTTTEPNTDLAYLARFKDETYFIIYPLKNIFELAYRISQEKIIPNQKEIESRCNHIGYSLKFKKYYSYSDLIKQGLSSDEVKRLGIEERDNIVYRK